MGNSSVHLDLHTPLEAFRAVFPHELKANGPRVDRIRCVNELEVRRLLLEDAIFMLNTHTHVKSISCALQLIQVREPRS